MAIRDGSQYTNGLRDGREVWYGGERIADVTKFPYFEAAVRSIAELYDMQHLEATRQLLVCHSEDLGEEIGRSFQIPRTAEDLRLKREAYLYLTFDEKYYQDIKAVIDNVYNIWLKELENYKN